MVAPEPTSQQSSGEREDDKIPERATNPNDLVRRGHRRSPVPANRPFAPWQHPYRSGEPVDAKIHGDTTRIAEPAMMANLDRTAHTIGAKDDDPAVYTKPDRDIREVASRQRRGPRKSPPPPRLANRTGRER